MNDVDRLVARVAPDPGPGTTPLAWELMEEITSLPVAPPARPRRHRRWLAVPAIAVLAVVLSWIFPVTVGIGPASAALDIRQDGGYYVITVKDLMADPEVYQAELQARGINVKLKVVPTSASMAGGMTVLHDVDRIHRMRPGESVPAEGPIHSIAGPGPCRRFDGCKVGLKVPVDYKKEAEVTLGREARPGEPYEMRPRIDWPGEPFDCVDYVNKTVAEVVPILRQRGVTATFSTLPAKRTPSTGWHVYEGYMASADEAVLYVGPEPSPHARPVTVFCSDKRD
ncbi:hypothetical protein [Nonomuraea sp. SYSU D8015]|uniref:hypothetical protein n=1 Tax=Nonomuraea sp. SYSU D8015 TaxID=2593644 RepID=UPI001661505E|nr:hypothetical protein [Nonomuraea sp. SYSU D8015]